MMASASAIIVGAATSGCAQLGDRQRGDRPT